MRYSVIYIWMIVVGILFFTSCMKKHMEFTQGDTIVIEAQKNDTYESLAGQYLHDPKNAWMIKRVNNKSKIRPGDKIVIPLTSLNRGVVNPDGYQMVPIICYDHFEKDTRIKNKGDSPFFEQQLDFIKKNNYQVIPLTRLIDFVGSSVQIPEKAVVITIDDNSLDITDWVVPLLEKYSFPATIFVDLSNIGKKGYLSFQQLKNMVSRGFTIASRNGWGIDVDIEDKPLTLKDYFLLIERDISVSKTILEKETGGKCLFYALPPEGGNNLLINLLKKKGYKGALNSNGDSNSFFSDPYNLSRIRIPELCPKKDFEMKLMIFRKIDLH